MDPDDVLYVQPESNITFYSTNAGITWDSLILPWNHLSGAYFKSFNLEHIYTMLTNTAGSQVYHLDLLTKKLTRINIPDSNNYYFSLYSDFNNNIYCPTNALGIFKSTDCGINWTNIECPVYQSIEKFSASHGNVFFSTENNIYLSTDRGNTWKFLLNDYYSCNNVFVSTNNNIYILHLGGSVCQGSFTNQVSRDFGKTWDAIFGCSAFMYETSNGSIIFNDFDNRNVIYTTADLKNFSGWDTINYCYSNNFLDSGDNLYLPCSIYSSKLGDSIMVQKWSFNQKRFVYSKYLYFYGNQSNFFIGVYDSSCMFIFKGKEVFKSTDDLDTWTKLTNFNFDVSINQVCITQNHTIWLATSGGIIYSSDKGDSWHLNNEGLNSTNISAINDSRDGYLYIINAGVLYISDKMTDDNENIQQTNEIKIEYFDKSIKISGFDLVTCDIKIYNLLGELMNNSLYATNSCSGGIEVNCGNLNTGVYIINLTNREKNFSKPVLVF